MSISNTINVSEVTEIYEKVYFTSGAGKSLARQEGKKLSDQTRDLFNTLPTKLNTLLIPLL